MASGTYSLWLTIEYTVPKEVLGMIISKTDKDSSGRYGMIVPYLNGHCIFEGTSLYNLFNWGSSFNTSTLQSITTRQSGQDTLFVTSADSDEKVYLHIHYESDDPFINNTSDLSVSTSFMIYPYDKSDISTGTILSSIDPSDSITLKATITKA